MADQSAVWPHFLQFGMKNVRWFDGKMLHYILYTLDFYFCMYVGINVPEGNVLVYNMK